MPHQWAPRKRDRSRSRSRGRDEEEQHSKEKGPSDEFPGPSAAQWNSWLPKPKTKEKGKGKNKEGKGDLKGKGKGHVNEMLNFGGSPLGQLQDSWSCALAAHTEHWDPDSDLNSLLPICALSSPSTKIAEPDSWAQVKTRKHGHGKSSQLESQTDSRPKTNQFSGSRFAVLADDMDKSFPVFNAEQKQHVPKPRMSACPKEIAQAASKSAVRKKKREQKSLLIAPVHEGVNDPEFTRRADELRQECWAERVKVKADTRFGQRQILCRDRPNQCFAFEASKDGRKGVASFITCRGLGSS